MARKDKGKLYALHAPEVECIAKGMLCNERAQEIFDTGKVTYPFAQRANVCTETKFKARQTVHIEAKGLNTS